MQAIGLLAHLLESKHNHGPFLVIAPLSTLSNWASEFAKWTPTIKVQTYKGNRAERTELWCTALQPGAFHVLLCSYDYVLNPHDKGKLRAVLWKFIIVDEGARLKNHQSKLALTLAQKYKHVPNRLILSGTPLQNSLREVSNEAGIGVQSLV
jgi:SNF2 family DNA or RNA helicase